MSICINVESVNYEGGIIVERQERAAFARTTSACPSASDGGSLGRIAREQTVPAFEEQLAHMTPGEICSWRVETCYGFHVVRRDERSSGRQYLFEAVRERSADYLRESVARRAVS